MGILNESGKPITLAHSLGVNLRILLLIKYASVLRATPPPCADNEMV